MRGAGAPRIAPPVVTHRHPARVNNWGACAGADLVSGVCLPRGDVPGLRPLGGGCWVFTAPLRLLPLTAGAIAPEDQADFG